MKKSEVKIGSVYNVKVSGTVQPVRLSREYQHGGWIGINLNTNREVRIRTAAKLRFEILLHQGKWQYFAIVQRDQRNKEVELRLASKANQTQCEQLEIDQTNRDDLVQHDSNNQA